MSALPPDESGTLVPLIKQASVANRLLRMMPPEAFEALETDLAPARLPARHVLVRANTPVDQVHFPTEGIASTVAVSVQGRRLEVGIFGREGLSAPSLLLGSDQTPYETFMQVEGESLSLPAKRFEAAVRSCEPLRSFLLRYVQVLQVQTAQTAMSNGSYNIEERTARWLLMCHDRIDQDALPLTHEFLGMMLGVRRSSVTDSLHVLEGLGIIHARRGVIEVKDRDRLEQMAGESYGLPEAEYNRLIGPLDGAS